MCGGGGGGELGEGRVKVRVGGGGGVWFTGESTSQGWEVQA